MFERLFKLKEHDTTVRTEVIAGVTTFLTMSYIIFVNPDILSTTGMDRDAVFVATCLAAALGSAVMALVANWPIGMAPGMGLNAFFAFTVVAALGFTWQQALGAVFISGLIFLLLTVTGVRSWLIAGIPHSLRSAIAAGIGLFLGIIALKNAGIVVDNPATLVGLGDLKQTGPLLAILGFFVIAVLDSLKVRDRSSSAYSSSPSYQCFSVSPSSRASSRRRRASPRPSCSSISWAPCMAALSTSSWSSCSSKSSMRPAR